MQKITCEPGLCIRGKISTCYSYMSGETIDGIIVKTHVRSTELISENRSRELLREGKFSIYKHKNNWMKFDFCPCCGKKLTRPPKPADYDRDNDLVFMVKTKQGREYKIYADGWTEGFPNDVRVTNYYPSKRRIDLLKARLLEK